MHILSDITKFKYCTEVSFLLINFHLIFAEHYFSEHYLLIPMYLSQKVCLYVTMRDCNQIRV